jgi:hypothetical protein
MNKGHQKSEGFGRGSPSHIIGVDKSLICMRQAYTLSTMAATKNQRNRNGAGRRQKTIVKKSYELGEIPGIDIAVIIRKRGGRDGYLTYTSTEDESFPPTMAEIVSGDLSAQYILLRQRYRKSCGLLLRCCSHMTSRRQIARLA